MWLALALVLTQVEPATSPPLDAPLEFEAEQPVSVRGDKPGLFSQPRTTPGLLVGRIGLGFLGTLGGVIPGGLVLAVGALLGGFNSGIGVPVAILGGLLAVGGAIFLGALGASAFGENRGADYLDAVVVLCVVLGGTAVLALVLFAVVAAITGSVGYFGVMTAAGTGFVGLAAYLMTPLIVQLAKKPDGPEPTLTLATF